MQIYAESICKDAFCMLRQAAHLHTTRLCKPPTFTTCARDHPTDSTSDPHSSLTPYNQAKMAAALDISFSRRCSRCRVSSTSSKGRARAACRPTGSCAHRARMTHRPSLRAAAPLEGPGSNPAVEDLPHGPGGRCRRRGRRRCRCCRRHRWCSGALLGGRFSRRFMACLCAFLMPRHSPDTRFGRIPCVLGPACMNFVS